MACKHPKQSIRDAGNQREAEYVLEIWRNVVGHMFTYIGGKVSLLTEIPHAVTGYRHKTHQQPVADQQPKSPVGLSPYFGIHHDHSGKKIAETDPVQHTVKSPSGMRTTGGLPQDHAQN